MKYLALVLALASAAALSSIHPEDLTVHEWGTFTSVAGADGAATAWDALGGESDLPDFVNYKAYRCFKFALGGTVRMETPVIYFYAPREVKARVNVQFPHGVITEWYPDGDNAIYESKSLMDRVGKAQRSRIYSDESIYQTESLLFPPPDGLGPQVVRLSSSLNGIDTSLGSLMSALNWTDVKIEPNSHPAFPVETGPSRYYAARNTGSAPLTAAGQHEKFLFYRGVGRFPVPLSARVSVAGQIAITNTAAELVPMAILFENRGGQIGYRDAGPVSGAILLDPPVLDGSLPQLRTLVEDALVAQSLFPREAHAMIETWQDSWFEEGSRLIYIVPSPTLDAILPLQIDPRPSQTARVFVGRIELITPSTKRFVESAMLANDPSMAHRFGRFLNPILERIAEENPAMENQIQQFRVAAAESLSASSCR
jgi:hypothetical protein